jgi:hypothetical protein
MNGNSPYSSPDEGLAIEIDFAEVDPSDGDPDDDRAWFIATIESSNNLSWQLVCDSAEITQERCPSRTASAAAF